MQNVKLNLIPGSVMPVVNVSQYDKARQFSITVYEGASTYSLTGKDVQIRGTKPDGNGFAYDSTDGVVSVSGSTVTISTTQQMTAVGGQTMAELRITQSGVILGTLNFVLMVEPSALSDDTPISDTDIPAIERDFEAALAEAEADALKAEGYAVGTQDGTPAQSGEPYYQDNAKYYKEQAEAAASGGGADALKAEGYAVGTQHGVPVTSGSPYYHNNAAYYDGEASTSATNAATSETNAGLSETAAGNSATSAAADALKSEGWAVGEQNGTPVSSGSPYYQNNAEYYCQQASQYATGGLIFKGSVAFASIPTTGMVNGDMYNITDDFTTDNRFIEGAGVSVKAGADIAWIDSVSKWDILALGGGTDSLSGLQDVTLTSPASGQVLKYDGSKWANANLPTVPADLDDLGDVDLTTPTSGQFLKYDGAKWVNGNGGGGASALDDLTDVDITTPADGNLLQYNGTSQEWENSSAVPDAIDALEQTGAVNFVQNTAVSEVRRGVTFTVNPSGYPDGAIMLSSSAAPTGGIDYQVNSGFKLKAGTYYLFQNDYPSTGYASRISISIKNGPELAYDGNYDHTHRTFTLTQETELIYHIYANSNGTIGALNNVVIYPMISLIPNADYQPYAMTNRELTEVTTTAITSLSSNNNYSISGTGHIHKCGRFCELSMQVKCVSSASSWIDVLGASSLPIPVTAYPIYQSFSETSGSGSFIAVGIKANGGVILSDGAANKYYNIFITYITQ